MIYSKKVLISISVIFTLMLSLLAGCTDQQSQNGYSSGDDSAVVVVLVNGESITSGEISNYSSENSVSYSDGLQQLIDQKVLYQQAKKEGYNVTLDEAETTLISILSEQNQTLDAYKQYLQSEGITYEEHLQDFQRQLAIQRYQNDTFKQDEYNLTDDQVESSLENYLAQQNVTLDAYKQYLQDNNISYESKLLTYKEALQQRLLVEDLREEAEIEFVH
jgi:hypothetical protein